MSDDSQNQIQALQKENLKLSRQLSRLQAAIERNDAAAMSAASITTMQIAERRKQEIYLRSILTNSPSAILLLDSQCCVAYCTQKTLEIAGIDYFAAINGKHYREIFKPIAAPEWLADMEQRIDESIANGTLMTMEVVLGIRIGEHRRYRVEFAPQTGTDAQIGGSILAMHDITEIRKMQEAAEEARQRAEQASLAKSSFLANMSHEIRTPMNAIIGMTAIGIAADDQEKRKYCLTKIEEASKHLLGIINDILDMSKIEANRFELSYSDVYFEQVLQRVTNFVTLRVVERHQDFSTHIDPLIPAIFETDEQRLAQVLTNLLANAVKFTPEKGTVSLNVQLVSEEDGECTLRFAISDTGIGIAPEQAERLFQSFEQADSGTARKFGGTGLGLAISKQIVEAMGGRIWIQSEVGKGSTFSFEIRVKRKSKENAHELYRDLSLDNMRMLVVDDSPEVLEYFAHLAEKLRFHCDVADSAAKACELIKERGMYDAYFIDRYMPVMNGVELTQQIRQQDSDRSIIIMISAEELHHFEEEARAAGVDSFLQKPVYPSAIVDCLNNYVGSASQIVKKDANIKKDMMLDNIFAGKHILLVEDIKINREIVKAQLAITSVEIDTAENGKEGVKMFAENFNKYDMIFMDMQMPEMDGLEATQTIRALEIPRAQTIPIVAMTANVFREDIEQCLAVGMNDHIGKPLDLPTVIDKIKRYTDGKRAF